MSFECIYCKKSYKSAGGLTLHTSKCAVKVEADRIAHQVECPHCHKICKNQQGLGVHLGKCPIKAAVAQSEKVVAAELALAAAKAELALKAAKEELAAVTAGAAVDTTQCVYCGKTYKVKGLSTHQLKCKDKLASDKAQLIASMFQCKCKKMYKTKKGLENHLTKCAAQLYDISSDDAKLTDDAAAQLYDISSDDAAQLYDISSDDAKSSEDANQLDEPKLTETEIRAMVDTMLGSSDDEFVDAEETL